ncbi:Bud-site selection protein [Cucurbitaria berberidis CBS 394.84]|uniref:Bud-site selection protein n=1 Tax=Cucurbitaria berberidis CBS 394.84 TaxID=1168544 RepID=A0A9P4GRQ5_9PLEO|nr:Bud-site selection protein [Cucurbitaria berberidis CBS 394.84]KAF1850135.1 Bud-site selection protein [Cucurbitaria berberidis CBS 394.84]
MVKRKRSSPDPTQSQPSNTPARRKKLCTERLTTALKSLVVALRLGAGFERQKHSRRKKTAQAKKDEKTIARLEIEYAVLKGLDLEKVADQLLRRTVGKVKSLKDAEALQEYINGSAGGEEKGYEGRVLAKDPATLNVTARLYKVPAVKKVVDEVIEDLKAIIGASETSTKAQSAPKDTPKKQKKSKAENEDVDMLDVSDEEGDPYEAFSTRIAAPSSGGEDSEDSISGDERPPSIGDSESEHDPEADLDEASDDSEADAFPSFDSEAEDTDSENEHKRNFLSVATPSVSADSDSDDESLTAPSKSKAKPSKNAKITSSAFLPALSHAAYFSGSESEASDLEEAPRKNRRGQRARQKIAEAKYGATAKHLEKADRTKGWDAKRGAVGDDRRGRGDRSSAPKGRGPQQSGGNAEPIGQQKRSEGVKRDDKGELHPSWQAAKAAKESKKLTIDINGAKPQGKKVVFD